MGRLTGRRTGRLTAKLTENSQPVAAGQCDGNSSSGTAVNINSNERTFQGIFHYMNISHLHSWAIVKFYYCSGGDLEFPGEGGLE